MKLSPPVLLSILILVAPDRPATPQTTRQEQIRKERENKAKKLRPYRPGKIEAGLIKLEESRFIERLLTPREGFYPRVGRVTSGAGLALGPGYRVSGLFGNRIDFLASTAFSNKQYWLAEATLSFPRLAGGRLFFETGVRRRDFPQEDFFGLGPGSKSYRRSNYSLRDTAVNLAGGIQIKPPLRVGIRVEYLSPTVGPGRDRDMPSSESFFTDSDAPGFAVQPDFWRHEVFLDLDYRKPAPNARSGGWYSISLHHYRDRELKRYSFRRLDVELQQFLPVLHGHRVLALRALASFSDAGPGQEVPFYLQRSLGGSHSLRGYRSYRFRDRNLLLLQAEYRWEILPFLGGALFYDAGMVSPDWRALGLGNLERDYGIGLRVGSSRGVFFRTDLALGGREKNRFLVRFNHAF